MASTKLAFIGSGNLASAIVRGLLAKKIYASGDIACTSKTGGTAQKLAADTGITFEPDLAKLLASADTVVVAFKPQSLAIADPRLAELTTGKLVLSVLAGKKIARLAQSFPRARNIIRTMPNTPAAIGAGMTPYCSLTALTDADRAIVEQLLGALGKFVALGEEHMDAVTALVGSGPAFLFEFVAALRDGGIAAGLSREHAQTLALETALGAAKLLAHTGLDPEVLRDKVVSPNGTTYAGLQTMAARNFRETMKETILAAAHRANELSRD
ncbi:pyrroline-5-carboxylate reductase [Oleiharenicola lentus]|uniref:pyrroline-5-carboxylate reductase n=1 Tax=Oleiharenicola lentus TaxID=2508720 RepID=UPI003F66B764